MWPGGAGRPDPIIAAGKANKEIAQALCISTNTVAVHVAHVLAKTGASNRTEAAAYAVSHHLFEPTAPPARSTAKLYTAPASTCLDVSTRIARAERFFGATGATLGHGGNRAFYRPSTDSIVMPPLRDLPRRRELLRHPRARDDPECRLSNYAAPVAGFRNQRAFRLLRCGIIRAIRGTRGVGRLHGIWWAGTRERLRVRAFSHRLVNAMAQQFHRGVAAQSRSSHR
jgi:hypothetical protein